MSNPSLLPRIVVLLVVLSGTAATIGVSYYLYQRKTTDSTATPSEDSVDEDSADHDARLAYLVAQRGRMDRTIWADEVLAQEHEQVFVELWDSLRAADDKWNALAKLPFERLILPAPQESQAGDLAIEITHFSEPGQTVDRAAWEGLLAQIQEKGYRLVQSEWHHSEFHPATDGQAARSTVKMMLHVDNQKLNSRTIIEGGLKIQWAPRPQGDDLPRPLVIDATDLRMIQRQGDPAFHLAFKIQPDLISPLENSQPATPLVLLYDMNRDGLSELILPEDNEIYWNLGDWKFDKKTLFKYRPSYRLHSAVIADFTGDGLADMMGAGEGFPVLFVGDSKGMFSAPAIAIDAIQKPMMVPSVFSAGDIDGDGDLDVWIAQYKLPYAKGQMPTPFFDSNDGYPAYLLRNDGEGRFWDITELAGLAPKRFRRTFSGSLVDLDNDNDLDLVICSDYAGLDVYMNDGQGNFTDVSDTLVGQDAHRRAFGMSLTYADYNLDGKLDFFMTGMGSTTARRLDQLGLGREDFPMIQQMRKAMGYGNRMYLATGDQFQQAPFNDQVSRTGWTWGATSFDFDNDGDRDIYVANGHQSRGSVKDYCTQFWRHDVYIGNSKDDPAIDEMFQDKRNYESITSWNGYEHNSLLTNGGGKSFLNTSFLMGVAFEFDSRNVASDDLNGDGRMDLIVVENTHDSPFPYEIHVLENRLVSERHWIGVRLREQGDSRSPQGASVILKTAQGVQVDSVVTGDSLKVQHAPTVHFGLGSEDKVDSIEVVWIDGTRTKLDNPQIDQYHIISK